MMGLEMPFKGVDTLERGDVFFFFRPRGAEVAANSEDIQRMFVVLKPEESQLYRLLVIGRKRFPRQREENKSWGFIDAVSNEPKKIENRLAPEAYRTNTRGESHFPALRPIGEGVYCIVRHDDHTHWVYALELPKATGGAQAAFELENQAGYIICIKNPEEGSPLTTDFQQPVDLPKSLQEKFRDRRFCEADPTDFLNYPGLQFVLISADENGFAVAVIKELGIILQTQEESLASIDIFNDLEIERSIHPSSPLFKAERG